jgi:hypothetical protein
MSTYVTHTIRNIDMTFKFELKVFCVYESNKNYNGQKYLEYNTLVLYEKCNFTAMRNAFLKGPIPFLAEYGHFFKQINS